MLNTAPDHAATLGAAERGARIALTARYYAAHVTRRGFCYPADLLEAGFRPGPLLDHWPAIRAAGEALVARVNAKARP